eukprot:GHVH01012259.1.p1 GENE.GHVH01012259.1~~GHVH01012259.1.p1  ORF type:complete len:1113 (+),score=129.88 GHVH01012259.1:35-3373(+)
MAHLVPRELDNLTLTIAGQLSQKRLARGLRLNAVEASSLLAFVLLELIRDGVFTVASATEMGKCILGSRQVLPGVSEIIHEIQVEGTFMDGTKLVTVHDPICKRDGFISLALHGSFLPVPSPEVFDEPGPCPSVIEMNGVPAGNPSRRSLTRNEQIGVNQNIIDSGPVITDITTYSPQSHQLLDYITDNDPSSTLHDIIDIHQDVSEATTDEDSIETTRSNFTIENGSVISMNDSYMNLPGLLCEDIDTGRFPGQIMCARAPVHLNRGKERRIISVTSLSDRPIQVGSHYPFFEVNKSLIFNRKVAIGMRLDIPAGAAVRFEPGIAREVMLVELGGTRTVFGGNSFLAGSTERLDNESEVMYDERVESAFRMLRRRNVEISDEPYRPSSIAFTMPRELYVRSFGPTTGDRIRLADTSMWVTVERDLIQHGDECKFGGGKVLRESAGMRAGCADGSYDTHYLSNRISTPRGVCLDLVITNVLVLDPFLGVTKCDIGVKDGRIAGIGNAGNPDVMDNVHPDLVIGTGTEVVSGELLFATAGAVDCHIHFITPGIIDDAVASGITTLIGGGTGPATGTCATTCTPGRSGLRNMMEGTDCYPLNFGFTGKGSAPMTDVDHLPVDLVEQIEAGAIGLKIHEDWGASPAVIDAALSVADAYDIQVTIHTDTLNESGCIEDTIAAIGGRTIHAYHTEGAGGGHAPDIIKIVSCPHVIPSSTNPTRPFTVNTIEEHVDMLMTCHHLDKHVVEDLAFAESRIRGETIQAEEVLHELGAISVISSDSMAMGRVGEVISRTWQTAHAMKHKLPPPVGAWMNDMCNKERLERYVRARSLERVGLLPYSSSILKPPPRGDTADHYTDNNRVMRYLSKYTINPSLAHGVAHEIGSLLPGRLADIVLWKFNSFGAKPEMIIKQGVVIHSTMGPANASIPTTMPQIARKQFGWNQSSVGTLFTSRAACDSGLLETWNISKKCVPVLNCRDIRKSDMVLNRVTPVIDVDPESYMVSLETSSFGTHLSLERARSLSTYGDVPLSIVKNLTNRRSRFAHPTSPVHDAMSVTEGDSDRCVYCDNQCDSSLQCCLLCDGKYSVGCLSGEVPENWVLLQESSKEVPLSRLYHMF